MCVSTCRRLYLYIALVRWDFRVCCGCVLLGAHTAELISSGWQSRWGLMYVGACRRLYLHIALVRWDFRVCCGCVPLGTHTAELISSGWQSRWGLMCYKYMPPPLTSYCLGPWGLQGMLRVRSVGSTHRGAYQLRLAVPLGTHVLLVHAAASIFVFTLRVYTGCVP